MLSLQSSGSVVSCGDMPLQLAADPRVGSFDASFHEPHQIALGRVTLFLPRAGEEVFLIASVDDTLDVRLDLGNHPQLALPLLGIILLRSCVTHVAIITQASV